MTRKQVISIGGALVLAGISAPVQSERPPLAMLGQLDSGRWELRMREAGGTVEQICFSDAKRLIQLRHPGLGCERLIVSDDPVEVVVQYTCKGRGYGRTRIRRESNRLIQLDSQGIAGGLPFAFAAEGRRIGSC